MEVGISVCNLLDFRVTRLVFCTLANKTAAMSALPFPLTIKEL